MVCPFISVDRSASHPVFLIGYGTFNFLRLLSESMYVDTQRFWMRRI